MDKQDAVNTAQKIGTYETSIQPAPDCCTVFQPEKPVIYGRIEECNEAEASFDVEELVAEALMGTERIKVRLDD